jgi:putative PIN family toxin of toxin-antitoxin system
LIKIVVDANLFASALIKPDSNPGNILELIKQNEVELVISPSVIIEIKRILLYPKIQKYHQKTAQQLDTFFDDLLIFGWVVEGQAEIDVIQTDPTDNKYLACALEGEADYIVSGDRHLLDIGLYQGSKIIKAKAFLKIWDKQLNT